MQPTWNLEQLDGVSSGSLRLYFEWGFSTRFHFTARDESYHSVDGWFSTEDIFAPHGTFGDVWRQPRLSPLGGGGCCHWRVVGRSWGCCQTSYMHGPHDKAASGGLGEPTRNRFPDIKGISREVIPKDFSLKENLTIISSKTLCTQSPTRSDGPCIFEIHLWSCARGSAGPRT